MRCGFLCHIFINIQKGLTHYFNILCPLIPHKATLLVAINEIKKSASKQGLSFYEYGMYLLLNSSVSLLCYLIVIVFLTQFGDDPFDNSSLFVYDSDAKSRPQH